MKFKKGDKIICIDNWNGGIPSIVVGDIYTVTKVDGKLLALKEINELDMIHCCFFEKYTKLHKVMK